MLDKQDVCNMRASIYEGRLINEHDKFCAEVPQQSLMCLPHATDAPEPMLKYDSSKVYVIGGIVDRTVRKGITSAFAVRLSAWGGCAATWATFCLYLSLQPSLNNNKYFA